MDVTNSANLDAGMYALKQSQDVKTNEVLGALGMTPQTINAEKEIDESMKQSVAQASGQGINIDFKA